MIEEFDDGAGTTVTYKGIAEYGTADGFYRDVLDEANPIWIMKKIVEFDDGAGLTITQTYSVNGTPHKKFVRADRATLNWL
jgi:hypothetical protein